MIEASVVGYVGRQLLADLSVGLGESGDVENTPLPLAEVAVDLPATLDREDGVEFGGILERLIETGNSVLTPSLLPSIDNRTVIVAGPGQGKTTVGRLLCQLYRVALLSDRSAPSLGTEVREQTEKLSTDLSAAGLRFPLLHRWPIWIRLSEYGDRISGGEDVSLLRFLTEKVNARASDRLDVAQFKRWLSRWPSLVVLDGWMRWLRRVFARTCSSGSLTSTVRLRRLMRTYIWCAQHDHKASMTSRRGATTGTCICGI